MSKIEPEPPKDLENTNKIYTKSTTGSLTYNQSALQHAQRNAPKYHRSFPDRVYHSATNQLTMITYTKQYTCDVGNRSTSITVTMPGLHDSILTDLLP